MKLYDQVEKIAKKLHNEKKAINDHIGNKKLKYTYI